MCDHKPLLISSKDCFVFFVFSLVSTASGALVVGGVRDICSSSIEYRWISSSYRSHIRRQAPDVRQTRRRQKTMESIETIEVEGIACFVSSGRQLFSADKLVGNTPMYCTDLSDKTPLVSSPHHHRRWIDVSINSNSCCQTLMSTNCFHFSNHICGFRGSATPQGTSKQPSAKRVSLHFEKKPEVF